MKIVRAFSTEFKKGGLATIKQVSKTTLGNILPNTQKSVRTAILGAQVYCETTQLGAIVPDYDSARKLLGWHWATKHSQEFLSRFWARRNRQEILAIGRRHRLEGSIEHNRLLPAREIERVAENERTAYLESNPQAKVWLPETLAAMKQ